MSSEITGNGLETFSSIVVDPNLAFMSGSTQCYGGENMVKMLLVADSFLPFLL